MMRWFSDCWFFVVCGIVLALLIAAACVEFFDGRERARRCEAGGGHIESRNCRTWYSPMTYSCGKGCVYTLIEPHETCDRVCIGARPEASP